MNDAGIFFHVYCLKPANVDSSRKFKSPITVVIDAVFEHGVTASLGNDGQIERPESFCADVLPNMFLHAIAVLQFQKGAQRPHQRVDVEALQVFRLHGIRLGADQTLQ